MEKSEIQSNKVKLENIQLISENFIQSYVLEEAITIIYMVGILSLEEQ